MACTHKQTTAGLDRPYMGSVAVHPYTEPEPRAAGGISYTETCSECGAERSVNVNGAWVEHSPWGESRAA